MEKGNHNDPEIISELLNLNHDVKFKHNILERLTEPSIFPADPVQFIKPILRNYIHNNYIRASIARYLSRYTIYINFHHQDQLEEKLSRIINLFKSVSSTNIMYFNKFLRDFLGGEKGAYLEFYADSFGNKFTEIDKIISHLGYGKLFAKDAQRAIEKIQRLQDSIQIPHVSPINEGNQKDLREELKMSINYLRNHGSEIFLSVSEGNPFVVDDKTATLLIDAFETLIENCLNALIPYKNLYIGFHTDGKNTCLELKSPVIGNLEDIRTVLEYIQTGTLTGVLKVNSSTFVINLSVRTKDAQILPQPFYDLFNYQVETYRDFLFTRKDPEYWQTIETFINTLDFDDQRLPKQCVRYATIQIETLSKLCNSDFQTAIEPYHKIKNKLRFIVNGQNLSEEDISEINSQQKKVQVYLRSCRFPNFEYVSLFKIGEKISDMFKDLKLVKFSLDVDADDMIYADPLILQDCVENLIFNACNAIRERGYIKDFEDDSINVRFFRENEHYTIACKDTGQGMSIEDVERFRKGKTGGIGSKIILKAVDVHEGNFEIRSKQGEGTEIRILLNVKEESNES